jgi:hypothetical protein
MNPQTNPETGHRHDRDIDHVLTALGNTQPPAHLEHRVLDALENRAVSVSRLPHLPHWMTPRSPRTPTRAWAASLGAVGLGAALILLAAALSVHKSGGPSLASGAGVSGAGGPATTSGALASTACGLATTSGGPASTSGGPAFRALAKGWTTAPRATALSSSASHTVILSEADRSSVRAVEGPRNSPHNPSLQALSNHELQRPPQSHTSLRTVLCDCDPTAVAEANAPSLPAPPLPLTAQEKLLLRIAHHPNPVELAELDPHQREAAIAEEQAAYKRFFHPPARQPKTSLEPEAAARPEPAPLGSAPLEPVPLEATQPQPAPSPRQQPTTTAPNGDQP